MEFSCWTPLFPYLPWQTACRLISDLGFSHVDLMARPAALCAKAPWDGLNLEPLVTQPEESAVKLHPQLSGLLPSALNVTPPAEWLADDANSEAGLRGLARFCHCAGIPVLAFTASDLLTQAGPAEDVARLRRWQAIAAGEAVQLAFEPNYTARVRSPAAVLRLLEDVPGLGLVMDPAHQVVQGFRQEQLESLWPFVTHVHARQARPGCLQARLAGGTIDWTAIVGSLRSVGYDGIICVENILLPDAAWLTSDRLDPVAETVATRELLQRSIASQTR